MTSPVRPYCGETIALAKVVAPPVELEPVRNFATGLLTKAWDEKPDTPLCKWERVTQDRKYDAGQQHQDEGREARARCWAYIFTCYEVKKAAEQSGQEDTKEVEHVRAEGSTPWK